MNETGTTTLVEGEDSVRKGRINTMVTHLVMPRVGGRQLGELLAQSGLDPVRKLRTTLDS